MSISEMFTECFDPGVLLWLSDCDSSTLVEKIHPKEKYVPMLTQN